MRANVHTPWAQARKHTFVVRVLRQASTYLEAAILDAHGHHAILRGTCSTLCVALCSRGFEPRKIS